MDSLTIHAVESVEVSPPSTIKHTDGFGTFQTQTITITRGDGSAFRVDLFLLNKADRHEEAAKVFFDKLGKGVN